MKGYQFDTHLWNNKLAHITFNHMLLFIIIDMCALWLAGKHFKVYPDYCPKLAGIGSGTLAKISGSDNGGMDGY